ncbi:MAG: WD40 repeat domain-containing protein [Gammaproteobacteria bacterium]|nr:WD40 repeat domain-containing protein [Gammaproteobacteria bacterium]
MKRNLPGKFVVLPKTQTILSCENQLCWRDAASGTIKKTWELTHPSGTFAFRVFDCSVDGEWLCLAGGYNDPKTNRMTGIYPVKYLLEDDLIRTPYVESNHLFRYLEDREASPSSDSGYVACYEGEATLMVRAPTASVFATIVGFPSGKQSLVVTTRSPDTLYLRASDEWMVDTPYNPHDAITALAISDNGVTITGSNTGRVCIWDSEHLLKKAYLHDLAYGCGISAVAVSSDGCLVGVGLANGSFSVLKLCGQHYQSVFQTPTSSGYVIQQIIFSPDAKNFLIINGLDIISVYSTECIVRELRRDILLKGPITDIAWVNQKTILITQKHRVLLLDIYQGIVFEKRNVNHEVFYAKPLGTDKIVVLTQARDEVIRVETLCL